MTYSYDPNDNIASISDQVGTAGTAIYGCDSVDRINYAFSNRSGAASTQTYAYPTGANQLGSVTDGSGVRSISYDGRGNTTGETRPGSVNVTTSYDGYARLTNYSRPDIGALNFTYNGLDDRVAVVLPTKTHYFVYDGDGRVLGEYGTSVNDVKVEFIWLQPQAGNDDIWGGDDGASGYMPLAVATPDSGGTIQINWVHGNHFGVPLVITDNMGGNAATPNDYFSPGFPGQSQILADLYYNRYRDYDPITGRYIQADPIGLSGGGNPYNYAENNPLRFTDPSGRFVPLALCAIGAATGAVGQVVGSEISGTGFNWKHAAVAAGVGCAAGVVAPVIATSAAGAMLLGAVSNVALYGLTQYFDDCEIKFSDVIKNAIGGKIGGKFSTTTYFHDTIFANVNNLVNGFNVVGSARAGFFRIFAGSVVGSVDP